MPLDTPCLRRVALVVAFAFSYSIIFVFSYSSALTYVCPNHIGSMFKMAVDVADGLALYGETYSQYGPLPTWIQASAISVFGRNVIVSAMTTMVFACATLVLLGWRWKRVLPLGYVAIAIVLQAIIQPDNSLPWPNVYMGFFSPPRCLPFFPISRRRRRGGSWLPVYVLPRSCCAGSKGLCYSYSSARAAVSVERLE